MWILSFWAFFRQVCDLETGGTWRQIQDEFGEGVDEGVGRMGGAVDGVQAADRKPGEKYIKYPLLRRFHALMLRVTWENRDIWVKIGFARPSSRQILECNCPQHQLPPVCFIAKKVPA